MRLDKYLKISRIIKRRTVANEACDAGRVFVNGKQARASYDVKENDLLEITLGERLIKVKVVAINEYARKGEASEMYQVIEE
jgi:Ribosome-associated heat shock protein implicated in the recycling of the 50S subunit (S4 paralog)